jgi:hypothetical protein
MRTIRSSSFGHRTFCGECGTPLHVRVDHQPETVDFSIATLDDPNAVAPEFHIFWGSKVGWFNPETTCQSTTSSGLTPVASRAPNRPTTAHWSVVPTPRDYPRATAGSGCAAPRRPSARPAGRP